MASRTTLKQFPEGWVLVEACLSKQGAGAAGKSRSLLGPEEELKNKDREEKAIYE